MSNPTRPQAHVRTHYAKQYAMTTRFRDNDMYGHINNSVYGEYFDTVVNQCLAELGIVNFTGESDIGLVVTSYLHFFAPVSFPDKVDIGLRIAHLGRTSIQYEFAMFKEGREEACAQGGYTHVFCDPKTLKPKALSEQTRTTLEPLVHLIK